MTQVSKYRLSEEIKKQIEDLFFQTIASLTSKEKVKEFFDEFLTKNEKVMFSKRLAIGIFLARGHEYREISRVLKVSTSTITSFAAIYKLESNYKRIVDRVNKNIESKKNILEIAESIASIGAVGGAKSAGWFETRNEIRKRKNKLL